MHRLFFGIAAGAIACATMSEPTFAVNPQPIITHASHEDCEIIVEIGKAKADWGPNGPNQPFAIDGVRSDGSIYREDCTWRDFGVGNPTAASGKPGTSAFGVDKPSYSSDGNTATTALDFVVIGQAGGSPPFMSVLTCTLDKVSGHWKLRNCEQELIT
jgi:hypothetical protein